MRTNRCYGAFQLSPKEQKLLDSIESPEPFRAFLTACKPDRLFRTRDCQTCPLAEFFQTQNPSYGFDPDGRGPALTWARAFGKAVDLEPGSTITAARALALLDFTLKELSNASNL